MTFGLKYIIIIRYCAIIIKVDIMKILIFSTAYYPFVGGAEVAIKEITDRLTAQTGLPAQAGQSVCDFDLVTARIDKNLPSEERVGNVMVYRVGFGNSFDKFLLPFIGCYKGIILDRKKHYNSAWSMMASQAGIAASFFKILNSEVSLVLTVQEGDEEEHLKRYVGGSDLLYKIFIQPLHRLVFKKADYITAISQDLKKRALRSGASCPIAIIPNGVDIGKYDRANPVEALVRSEGEKIIITTSRLVEKNGVDDLIKSLPHLTDNIKLWILGTGPDEGQLHHLAKELNVENRITFFGFVAGDLIPSYLKAADVFVRPSLSEGLGNSFLEAMACGIPVVGTKVGGIPDFLKDGLTGWFCEVKNPQSIAQKIEHIFKLENRDEVATVADNASRLVRENYNWEMVAIDMGKIFKEVNPQKKIVVATGTFPPEVSGQATYVWRFVEQLKSRSDIATHVVTYGNNEPEKNVTFIDRSPWRHLKYFLAIRKELRRGGIIYAQDLFSSGLPAALAKGKHNKLFIRLGGDFLWEKMVNSDRTHIGFGQYYLTPKIWQEKIFIRLFKFILWRADKVIFNNEWQKNIYQKFYHIPAEKIDVLLSYNLASFNLPQDDIEKNDEIIFAGRFIPLKNLRRLIKAFKQITTDKKLVIIGEGPLLEELKFLANDDSRIQIENRMDRAELWERIKKCYAFILPSLSEMNPNVAREAFNLRKPVILTKEVGFSPEAKKYFKLIDPMSIDEIRSGIEFFLDDKNYADHLEKIKDIYFYENQEEAVNKFLTL